MNQQHRHIDPPSRGEDDDPSEDRLTRRVARCRRGSDDYRPHDHPDAPFGLHNLGADLPYTTFEGIGHWLQMYKLEEFNCILDEILARVEV